MINGKISKLIFLKPQNIIFTYIQRLTLPTPGEISKKGIQPFFSIMAFSAPKLMFTLHSFTFGCRPIS